MKLNWNTISQWVIVALMAVFFLADKFGGSAEAMDARMKCVETKTAVLESSVQIELRNIAERMRSLEIAIQRKK